MADYHVYFTIFLMCLITTILVRWPLFKSSGAKYHLPPSPFSLPIIGHLHLLAPNPHQAFHKLSLRYGPVFRLFLGSVPCVVACSPEMAKEFLKTYENAYLDRPQNSAVVYLTYGSKDFSFAPYGSYWKFMKKIVTSQLLNGTTLDMFLPIRRDEINRFVKSISHKAKIGKAVDLEGEVVKITNNVISRMLLRERCSDLLDILLDISEDESMEIKLTRENIKAFIMDIFTAGTDTSAITIQWALAELINHPNIMKKAVEEIDLVLGKDRLLQESDIPNLPYLQAIIKETLRLHPAAPMVPRQSIEDCTVAGYYIPANTTIFVNVWDLGRDPKHWENPLEFRPERFQESQLDVRGQHFHMLPFGSGRRMCPGISFALPLIQATLGAMIQCFEWKAGKDGNQISVDMEEGHGLSLARANPLVCVPINRLDPLPCNSNMSRIMF